MNLAARFERKFVAEGFTLADVLALVRRHRAAFREAPQAGQAEGLREVPARHVHDPRGRRQC